MSTTCHLSLLLAAGVLATSSAGLVAAPVPPSEPREARVAGQAQPGPDARVEEARKWLSAFGYTLDADGVRNLTSARLTGSSAACSAALVPEKMHLLEVLTSLEELELSPRATDAWVAHIAGLKNLRSFTMALAPNLTDASMTVFAGLRELRVLAVPGAGVTDEGVTRLSALPRLEVLVLNHTGVTDGSLPIISDMYNLRSLLLSFTRVSDAGLRSLRTMRGLRRLDLQGTDITPAGADALRNVMRECWVVFP